MQFAVDNMTCEHCVRTITNALCRLDPNATIAVDLKQGRLDTQGGFSATEVLAALNSEGYRATVVEAAPSTACCGHCHS